MIFHFLLHKWFEFESKKACKANFLEVFGRNLTTTKSFSTFVDRFFHFFLPENYGDGRADTEEQQ
jgi:hypothetical protein